MKDIHMYIHLEKIKCYDFNVQQKEPSLTLDKKKKKTQKLWFDRPYMKKIASV